MSDGNNLRDSLNRWYSAHAPSGNASTQASSFFSSWSTSFNETAQDIYGRLPLTNQDAAPSEPAWFSLSRTERLLYFVCCLLASTASFTICIFLFPILAVKPRKFASLWTIGTLLFILSFVFLMGPNSYFKYVTQKDKLPFTIFFFATCLSTLYFAVIKRNSLLTLPFAALELIAVVAFILSNFPWGGTTLRWMGGMGVRSARGALSI